MRRAWIIVVAAVALAIFWLALVKPRDSAPRGSAPSDTGVLSVEVRSQAIAVPTAGQDATDAAPQQQDPRDDAVALIVGRVVTEGGGAPVADVRVTADDDGPWAVSDATGAFHLAVTPGLHHLDAHGRGCGSIERLPVDARTDEAVDVVVRVTRAIVVRGVVVDAEDHVLAGVVVHARDEARRLAEATTGADGTFMLAELLPGELLLQVNGHRPANATVVVRDDSPPLRVVMDPLQPVRGQVVRWDGTPVRTTVRVDSWRHLEPVPTDDDGRFEVWLPAGYRTIWADLPGASTYILVEGKPIDGLVLRGAGEARVLGIVVDQDQVPLENAVVYVTRDGADGQSGRTNLYGAFILAHVEGGRYSVHVFYEGEPLLTVAGDFPQPIVVSAGGELNDVRLVVRAPTGVISGRVVLADGEPLLWVAVHTMAGARYRLAQTNPDGEFRFTHVPPGRYVLEVGSARVRDVDSNTRDLVITLPR
jgi:hypothetical protein